MGFKTDDTNDKWVAQTLEWRWKRPVCDRGCRSQYYRSPSPPRCHVALLMATSEPRSGSLPVTSRAQSTESARPVGRFHPPTSRSSRRLKIDTAPKQRRRKRGSGRDGSVRASEGRSDPVKDEWCQWGVSLFSLYHIITVDSHTHTHWGI